MGMFWFQNLDFSLQAWRGQERMLHLDVNERSGADTWFSRVLNACREGCLEEEDYNFLHGYPTKNSPDTWYHRRHVNAGRHVEPRCRYEAYNIHGYWDQWPEQFECKHCWAERKRRARVLLLEEYPEEARQRLTQASFAKATLITPYNVKGSD